MRRVPICAPAGVAARVASGTASTVTRATTERSARGARVRGVRTEWIIGDTYGAARRVEPARGYRWEARIRKGPRVAAVLVRLRAELRRRWAAWLGIALVAGLGGGVVLGLLAGAQRSTEAYPRFVKAMNAADLVIGGKSPF